MTFVLYIFLCKHNYAHPSLLHDIVLGKSGPICSPKGVLLMLLQISRPRLEKMFQASRYSRSSIL